MVHRWPSREPAQKAGSKMDALQRYESAQLMSWVRWQTDFVEEGCAATLSVAHPDAKICIPAVAWLEPEEGEKEGEYYRVQNIRISPGSFRVRMIWEEAQRLSKTRMGKYPFALTAKGKTDHLELGWDELQRLKAPAWAIDPRERLAGYAAAVEKPASLCGPGKSLS